MISPVQPNNGGVFQYVTYIWPWRYTTRSVPPMVATAVPIIPFHIASTVYTKRIFIWMVAGYKWQFAGTPYPIVLADAY